MPSGAAVNHVEDDVLVYEQQVALHLCIERVCYLDVAGVAWPRARPFSAYLASLGDLRKHVQHVLGNATPLQHAAHGVMRGVPPSHVELAQGEADVPHAVCPEHPNDSAYVEVGPVVGLLGSSAGVSLLPAYALL
jgi:hypothetical protein